MKRFKFRLETVLRQREILETLREQEFATAQGQVIALESRIRVCREEIARIVSGRDEDLTGGVLDSAVMLNRERYLQTLNGAIGALEYHLEGAKIVAEETRLALVAARQARQSVAKLREKDWTEYTALVLKQEQDVLDEQATLRYIRGNAAVREAV